MSALPDFVQALLNPAIYPEPTQAVALVQTQMSFILLTDGFAYKVKKPVNLGYLDYSTLEKRRSLCFKEVELNRRLCAEAYLGVVAITREASGYALGGTGETVEYAVKMRRLPEARMLDRLLVGAQATAAMMDSLARRLAEFHKWAATSPEIAAFGSLEAITTNCQENFSQTESKIGLTISSEQYRRIKDYTGAFIRENGRLFQERMNEGRIRDCHGDLHAAHICFEDGICIYDCIEFNDRFRYGDIAAEVAFLAMDLDHFGHAALRRRFVADYARASGDAGLAAVFRFYQCYRAYVRGKVEGFKLDDPYIGADEKLRIAEASRAYFDLAGAYTHPRPTLFITVGLVGAGKSTIATALARHLGLVIISSDVTRKRLAGMPPHECGATEMDHGIYTPEFTKRTYEAMLAEAAEVLRSGDSVILDASFIRSSDRQRAMRLASENGAGFVALELTLDEKATRERLERRARSASISDGRYETYLAQLSHFEPAVEIPLANRVIIDASRPLAERLCRALDCFERAEKER